MTTRAMDEIATSMVEDWWDTSAKFPGPSPELDQFRERLLQQFYFIHVKFYLHRPFILKSPTISLYDHSRLHV